MRRFLSAHDIFCLFDVVLVLVFGAEGEVESRHERADCGARKPAGGGQRRRGGRPSRRIRKGIDTRQSETNMYPTSSLETGTIIMPNQVFVVVDSGGPVAVGDGVSSVMSAWVRGLDDQDARQAGWGGV